MSKISKVSFAKLFATLSMSYEWFSTDNDEKTKIWYNFLSDIHEGLLKQVVYEWIATEEKPPTIADLRNRCAVKLLDIPTALEAWDSVAWIYLHNGSMSVRDLPETTRNALESIGGGWAIKTSEAPSIIRSQFIKAYRAIVDELIANKNINHELGLPPKKEIQEGEKNGIGEKEGF